MDRMISALSPFTSSGSIDLTVALVPTGMNAGVLITPLWVVICPRRALPSVLISLKCIVLIVGAIHESPLQILDR